MSNCKTCGKPVVEANGNLVHEGAGIVEQECKNPACGWKGGQYGGYSSCPRCGDATSLVNNHSAN